MSSIRRSFQLVVAALVGLVLGCHLDRAARSVQQPIERPELWRIYPRRLNRRQRRDFLFAR